MALRTVLINGAEVRDRYVGNRGAEHLLRTVVSRLRAMGIRPAVTFGQVDPAIVSELALVQYVGNPRLDKFDSIAPMLNTSRLVGIKGLSGVLDASGFALGDAWGPDTAKWLLRKYRQWHRQGIPLIALPQAYGPFSEPGMGDLCQEALGYCGMIFPRDEVSRQHLQGLGLGGTVQASVPDITIGEVSYRPSLERAKRMVIVPNWNLAERGDRGAYFSTLLKGAEWANERGLEVVGVLHEGQKDLQLLQELRTVTNLRIVSDLTGWETKEFIAGSSIVLAGRYHAVLAALTTGTPVLTHSWSHKYGEVLRQFEVEDWMASPGEGDAIVARLEGLLAFSGHNQLEVRRREMHSRVDRMWHTVEDFLGSSSKGSL